MTAESGNTAQIDGQVAALPMALARAAKLLMRARQPLFAGLATDVAGARAALALAAVTGGVVDHVAGAAMMSLVRPLQDAGGFVVTPGETRARADSVLVLGETPLILWPEMAKALALAEPPALALEPGARRVLHLNPGAKPLTGAERAEFAGLSPLALISLLDARAQGHRVNAPPATRAEADRIAAWLSAARYGVIIFNAQELGALAVEALFRLVKLLNRTTRFTTLPLAISASAETFKMVCLWTTGFPGRVKFALGSPAYDPELYDIKHMVARSDVDLVLGIDSFGEGLGLPDHAPVQIMLAPSLTGVALQPEVFIPIGLPGHDHGCVMFDQATGTLKAMPALMPSSRPSAAAILEALRALVLSKGSAPC